MTTSAGHGERASAPDPRQDLALPSVLALGPHLTRFRGPLALVLGSIAFAVFSIRGLWDDGMLAFGDLPRFPTDASVFVDGFRQGWSDRGFGGPYPSITWFLAFASLLTVTGGDATLAQQLAMTLWIPVAFCGMAYLCRRFVETSWWLAALGGVIYVCTPISIGLFVGGAVGLIWSYALLPLVIAGAETLRRTTGSNLAWLALPVALLAATSPELLVFGIVVSAVWFVVGRGREAFLLAAVVAIGLAAVATLPALAGRGGIRLSDMLVEKMIVDFEYTYSEITPLHLLRLAGNHGDPMDPLGYNDATTWGYAGYFLVVALLAGLVFRRRGDLFVLRLVALGGLAFGALLGIALLTRAHSGVFDDIPAAFVFRNPGKLMMLLAVAIVPAAVYGIRRLFEVFPQHREVLRFVVAAGAIAYLGGYAGPALSGDWGVKEVRGSSFEADPALLTSARFIQNQEASAPGRWRAVWLPFDHTDALNLEWISPHWANEPVPENRDPEVEQAIALLNDSFDNLSIRQFHAIADRAAVRYVVLRAGVDPGVGPMFARDPQMTRLRRGQGFVVWRNTAALPRIRQYTGLKAVVVPDAGPPVRYRSSPILTLKPDALAKPTEWTTYGTQRFSRAGASIRARTTSTRTWPVLARRVPAVGDATYLLSAQVRTRNAADAHLKVIWYRGAGDRELVALDQDYAAPVLNGSNGWTRVSAVVESPIGTRFGEVVFLAGKRPEGSRRPATSWVRNLRMSNVFLGDPPATRTEAIADVVPQIGPRGYEVFDATGLDRGLSARLVPRLALDGVIVNPGFASRPPVSLRQLERAGRVEIVSRADTALRPRTGDWQRRGDSAVVVSLRGIALVPLGIVPAGRFTISVTGCRLGGEALQIVRRASTVTRGLAGPGQACGRFTSTRPVLLKGRTVVRMSLGRNASVAALHAYPARARRDAASASSLVVSAADTPSPQVAGMTSPGIVLADAYHPGWATSGSAAAHVRLFPGFNGFLVRNPPAVDGLHYSPQRSRNLLVVVGALGWVAIGLLLLFGRRRVRRSPTAPPPVRTDANRLEVARERS